MANNDRDRNFKHRGRPVLVSDQDLKQMAIDVKRKLRNQKLTYLLLEKHTGIGRQTWKRRMSQLIEELNQPVLREFRNMGQEDAYFPNIEEIFERNKNNKQKVINELLDFQQMFQDLYAELKVCKSELAHYRSLKDLMNKQANELKSLRTQKAFYESLYKSLVVSSAFSHLREKHGIKTNVIEFNKDIAKNSTLDELQSFFPEEKPSETDTVSEDDLHGMFPELFSKSE